MAFAYRARKHCMMCGRIGTQGFKPAPEQTSTFVKLYVCRAAMACMKRAKIGGYR